MNKSILVFLLVLPILNLIGISALAADAKPVYKAEIFSLEATVFAKPDFDSEVLGVVSAGKVFPVSSVLFKGAFYRIQIKPGVIGYIPDSDVKPLWKKVDKKSDSAAKSESKNKRDKPDSPRRRPFVSTQYVGLNVSTIEHKENTMGDHRRDQLMFYGVKLSGPNLVVDGDFPTEINFLFHSGAPKYYEEITGRPAEGWILMMNFLWQNYFPQSRDSFLFFGFGPNFKYAKYTLGLTETATSKNLSYSAEDMMLGAVFNFGISGRVGPAAVRAEYVYYWEKEMYGSFGFSLQKEF